MNAKIKMLINNLRLYIENNSESILFTDLEPGIEVSCVNLESFEFIDSTSYLEDYKELLNILNGGRFGVIDIFSFDDLAANQYYSANWDGQYKKWLVIGQILYKPLAIDKNSGNLYLFNDDNTPILLGNIVFFFEEYVFGIKYRKLISLPEDDLWLNYIESLNIS